MSYFKKSKYIIHSLITSFVFSLKKTFEKVIKFEFILIDKLIMKMSLKGK